MIIIEGLVVKNEDGLQEDLEYKRLTFVYTAALQQLEGKINTLSEEFKILHKYNPIEHISSRIKSKESIMNKLRKKGLDFNYENLIKTINDIAGMRIICSFIPDIYKMVEMIKTSGYSSYHLIVSLPISLSVGVIDVKVEIQIRTMAMDFWASLEHKINYKYEKQVPKNVQKELKECAKMTQKLDKKMSNLGNTLMQEEKELVKEITADYSTTYAGFMITGNVSL